MLHWSRTIYTKKNKSQGKKLSQMRPKSAKNGYLNAAFTQKHFLKSKICSLNAAHDHKLLSLREICSFGNFTRSRF